MEVSVKVDLAQIGRMAKTLDKETATVLRWRVRKAVTDVGGTALKRARANASWSRKIPRAITLRTSFANRSAGVTLKTDLNKVPYARLYERGSKGSGGRYIRHPVYGSQDANARYGVRARYDDKSTWRNIPTRPFFYRSVWGEKGELANKLNQEIGNALHELGFH